MKLEQTFTVPYPPARVWEYFGNVTEVTTCMPGASLTEPPDDNRVKFQLKVKLGPIAAAFAGQAEHERDDTTRRGVLRGGGRDARSGSRASGEVVYALAEEQGGDATRVDVTVDFRLAGSLAQFGRSGIVNDLGARLTAQFAANLKERLAAGAGAEGPAAGAPPGSGETELRTGSLLLSVLWDRLRRVLARLLGRG